MTIVYILRFSDNKLYIGKTDNIKRRLSEHLAGHVKSTSKRGEFKLIFFEAFCSEADASRREKYLKTTKGRATLKIMLQEYFSGIV